jgi:ribosomal protein L18
MNVHEEQIRVRLIVVEASLGYRRLEPNMRIHNGRRSVVRLEAVKVRLSAVRTTTIVIVAVVDAKMSVIVVALIVSLRIDRRRKSLKSSKNKEDFFRPSV